MVRTTSELVAGVVEADGDIDLSPFILTANALVTEVCEPVGYSDERLELIERWLAAHFYANRDMRLSREGVDDVDQTFQYRVGLMLANTMYGQQAMVLDTAGKLAALSKKAEQGKTKKRVSITWLGSE